MITLVLAISSTVATSSVTAWTPAPASAIDVCEDSAMFDPVALSFTDGPLGSTRRACTRREFSFGANAVAIIRTEEFYGNLRAAGVLHASIPIFDHTELFAALEVVRFQTVISSLSASHLGLGHLAIGGTRRVLTRDQTALAITAHTTLPTAIGLYSRTVTFALDAGVTGTTKISADLELHGYLGGRGSIGAGAGPAQPRGGLILDAGGAYRIARWFALALDLEGSIGERALLDHAALGLGMKFRLSDGFRVDVSFKAPLAGDERSLASAYAGVAYWD